MSTSEEVLIGTTYFGSSIITFLLIIIAFLVIYHFWFQSLRSTKLGNKLPGVLPNLPFVGSCLSFIHLSSPTEILNFALEKAKKTDLKLARFWIGNRLCVVMLDPSDIELVLGSHVHIEKSKEYELFEPWLGDGLLISKGEKWKTHRKMIAPTFHQSILKTFVPVFNKNAKDLVEQLRREVVGKVCDIHEYMGSATVNVLLETVMGISKNKETNSGSYTKAVIEMCTIIQLRQVRLWMRPNFIFNFTKYGKQQKSFLNIIHNFTDKVIVEKKRNYIERVKKGESSLYKEVLRNTEEDQHEQSILNLNFGSALRDDLDENDESVGQKKRLAFLDFMIEASQTGDKKLSDKEIREEVNTIMFEGHDTTAAASSFFIVILGVYPDIQEKVYQELEEIFQGSDRPVTFNDIFEMKYLERVLLETLRLYPPVPVITRKLREDLKLEKYIIPKGASIGIPQFLIHREPRFFPNPEKFDPDNFLPERCQARPYYSYIPFSAGPRSCVGRKYAMLKLKILLATIVRNFKIKSVVKEEDFKLQADIILKRSDGFRVILEERHRT